MDREGYTDSEVFTGREEEVDTVVQISDYKIGKIILSTSVRLGNYFQLDREQTIRFLKQILEKSIFFRSLVNKTSNFNSNLNY